MRINEFENTLDRINLSNIDIERQIYSYNLIFSKIRRQDVEWGMRFPMFVPPFYAFVKNRNSVPSQEEYWHAYFFTNSDFFKGSCLSQEQIEGLKARIFRTYPSLVRDLHFGLTLKSDYDFDDVFYNETVDIEYGIDLVVKKHENLLGLNLFTYTQIALKAREIKEYRPKRHVGFKCIELPVDFGNCKKCGQFFLYSDKEIDRIKGEMFKHV